MDAFCVSNAILGEMSMINGWLKINQFRINLKRFSLSGLHRIDIIWLNRQVTSLLLPTVLSFCIPLVWSHLQVLVHHKLSKVINHHVARRAKQPAIVHMKLTFRIISCPIIRSNIYRKMRSCFLFRRSTRRFNNKLIHGVFCLALNERSYILQATIELFAPILASKISRDQITSPENTCINNREWPINTKDCLCQ